MLLGFSVANFRSFKDKATLSLLPAPAKGANPAVDARAVAPGRSETGGLDVLKLALVYGPNASGKSNLIAALRVMQDLVLHSVRRLGAHEDLRLEPFRLNPRTAQEASELEVVFVHAGTRYRYGFRAGRRAIEAEWLYHVPHQREVLLFQRTGQDFQVRPTFSRSKTLADKTVPNALFLSVAAQFNNAIAERICQWFESALTFIALENALGFLAENRLQNISAHCLQDEEKTHLRARVIELLRRADLGIEGFAARQEEVEFPPEIAALRPFMELVGFDEVWDIQTRHPVWNDEGTRLETDEIFNLREQESAGTRRLFSLAGPIADVLYTGGLLATDELDNRLHPLLARAVIELFLDPATNPRHAQLLVATHEDDLLDPELLRRDQIWLTEKDRFGATHLYCLAELGGVRKKEAFREAYLRGRYGAVPLLRGGLLVPEIAE